MTPPPLKSPHLSLGQRLLLHLPLDKDLLVKRGRDRSRHLNRQLAWPMAFVAGAINAGGFLAIGVYTSHSTGSLSRAMDELALGHGALALFYFGIIAAFTLGAATAATFIHLGRRRRFHSPYGGALFIEAMLLLFFGAIAHHHPLSDGAQAGVIGACLGFFMGMLNAIAGSISAHELRVTHMTGIVTDLGVELAKLFYWNRHQRKASPIMADRRRMRLHGGILISFLTGGLSGALGFTRIGYEVVFVPALILLALSARPVLYDLRVRVRLARRP
jgi:uncharacterized membrane protein YoaK (UPF0700 family)